MMSTPHTLMLAVSKYPLAPLTGLDSVRPGRIAISVSEAHDALMLACYQNNYCALM